ncbi:MAG: toll/interleukin-1 receptor domain-containing protein [Gammaproteobacteria bacterium]
MSAIFISHSHADNVLAKKVLKQLTAHGYSVFLDFHPV